MTEETKNDIDEYIERYCNKHNVTPEEAREHALVQDVIQYYESREGGIKCES